MGITKLSVGLIIFFISFSLLGYTVFVQELKSKNFINLLYKPIKYGVTTGYNNIKMLGLTTFKGATVSNLIVVILSSIAFFIGIYGLLLAILSFTSIKTIVIFFIAFGLTLLIMFISTLGTNIPVIVQNPVSDLSNITTQTINPDVNI